MASEIPHETQSSTHGAEDLARKTIAYIGNTKERGSRWAETEMINQQAKLDPSEQQKFGEIVTNSTEFRNKLPKLALSFIGNHYRDIHDPSKGNGITAKELQDFLSECKPSTFAAASIKWILGNQTASGDFDRFKFLTDLNQDAKSSGTLTLGGIDLAIGKFNYLTADRAPNDRTRMMYQLDFLESHSQPPWLTQAHPNGLTRFKLDQMASDGTARLVDRMTAREIESNFESFKQTLGVSGDEIAPTAIREYRQKIVRETADVERESQARMDELTKHWLN